MKRITLLIVASMIVSTAASAWVQPGGIGTPIDPPPRISCDDIPISDDFSYGAHQAILDAGSVYEEYDDNKLKNIADQYLGGMWSWRSNDLFPPSQRRDDFVRGFAIYAMIRAAIHHRTEVTPATKFSIGCVLRDIRQQSEDTTMRLTCTGKGLRDSCAEEYMGRALAWAAHDGWSKNTNRQVEMFYNVDRAFESTYFESIGGEYSFMWYIHGFVETRSRLFNHDTESPVYAMLTIGHLDHIREMYLEAELPAPSFSYLQTQVEEILDWMRTKIYPSTSQRAFEFKEATCGHETDPWGNVCNCSDREENVGGIVCNKGGVKVGGVAMSRHPKHYPMLNILNHLNLRDLAMWPWNADGFVLEPGSVPGPHNLVFNCLFGSEPGLCPEPDH